MATNISFISLASNLGGMVSEGEELLSLAVNRRIESVQIVCRVAYLWELI